MSVFIVVAGNVSLGSPELLSVLRKVGPYQSWALRGVYRGIRLYSHPGSKVCDVSFEGAKPAVYLSKSSGAPYSQYLRFLIPETMPLIDVGPEFPKMDCTYPLGMERCVKSCNTDPPCSNLLAAHVHRSTWAVSINWGGPCCV